MPLGNCSQIPQSSKYLYISLVFTDRCMRAKAALLATVENENANNFCVYDTIVLQIGI